MLLAMEKKIVCNLVIDEMSIRKQVEWTGKKMTGYVDVGTKLDSDTLPEAKEVLVFMLVGLNYALRYPLDIFSWMVCRVVKKLL